MPNLLKLKNLHVIYSQPFTYVGFPGVSVVKNSSVSARDTGDAGLVPGSGSSLDKEMSTHFSILSREVSWTEEPRGLQSMGLQRTRHD